MDIKVSLVGKIFKDNEYFLCHRYSAKIKVFLGESIDNVLRNS